MDGLDCHGLPLITKDCHGLPWTAADNQRTHGLPWARLSHQCLQLCTKNFHGLPPSAIHSNIHTLLNNDEQRHDTCSVQDCCDLPWAVMGSQGLPRTAIDCHGLAWATIDCKGTPWASMGGQGLPWYAILTTCYSFVVAITSDSLLTDNKLPAVPQTATDCHGPWTAT